MKKVAARTIPGVKHVLAVASGKGGVGKSTLSVNLALGLAALDHGNGKRLRIGLMDADIYGPSIPRMMNLSGKPDMAEGKFLVPKENYGLRVMSMGFLVPEDEAAIWRGPMVMGMVRQLLYQVAWGELDVLVVDLPPGTGDAQLTLTQDAPLSGAVVVSTPQDIALIDALKAIKMFQRVNVPVLGMVQNMSSYICPKCGHEAHLFGHDGARATASRLGIAFLGDVPLHIDIRTTSDAGQPITVLAPTSPQAAPYFDIARQVWTKLNDADAAKTRQAPQISIQ